MPKWLIWIPILLFSKEQFIASVYERGQKKKKLFSFTFIYSIHNMWFLLFLLLEMAASAPFVVTATGSEGNVIEYNYLQTPYRLFVNGKYLFCSLSYRKIKIKIKTNVEAWYIKFQKYFWIKLPSKKKCSYLSSYIMGL